MPTAPRRPRAAGPQPGASVLDGLNPGQQTALRLQQTQGNRVVSRLLQRQAGWTGKDVATRGATSEALGIKKPSSWGWNRGEQVVGAVTRIPVDGLTQGNSQPSPVGGTQETAQQRAIVLVPPGLDPTLTQVDVFLHLHGHGVGYRQRSTDNGPGLRAGSVRDVDMDRFAQQIEASGKPVVGVLPQGTGLSAFGAGPGGSFANTDAYLAEVFAKVKAMGMGYLPPDAVPGRVILSGHSGAGNPLSEMMAAGNLPSGLREVILWDAINGPNEYKKISTWVLGQMADARDRVVLEGVMAAVVGLDPALAQQDFLKNRSLRFRAFHTGSASAKPDTRLAKNGGTYASRHAALRQAITKWLNDPINAAALGGVGSPLWTLLQDNFRVEARPGVGHEQLMGQGDKLKDELMALP
jgi:hypothetical protein